MSYRMKIDLSTSEGVCLVAQVESKYSPIHQSNFFLICVINARKKTSNLNFMLADPRQKETFLAGAFGILLTATVLTIFEAGFIFSIVIPGVHSSITSSLKKVDTNKAVKKGFQKAKKHITDDVVEPALDEWEGGRPVVGAFMMSAMNEITYDRTSQFMSKNTSVDRYTTDARALTTTFMEREKKLLSKVNGASKIKMFIIVLVLIMATRAAWVSAAPVQNGTAAPGGVAGGESPSGGPSERAIALYTALGTVAMLIAFQIYFYFVTQSYKFPGAMGSEELTYTVLNPKDVISGVIEAPEWACPVTDSSVSTVLDTEDGDETGV